MAKVMGWVEKLPEVGTPILNEREQIEAVVQRAANLVAEAERLRQQAYLAAMSLERKVREQWTPDEVNRAKHL